MQTDIEFLTTLEGVTFGETNLHLRTPAPNGAANDIHTEIEVVGLVEHAV